jgi:hypothetical protein
MNNIYEEIARMRKGMRMIGCSKEEIEEATNDVTNAEDYEDAIKRIKKYWQ